MLIACPHCTTVNRVPPQRAGEDPTCGQCGRPLLDGHPVALDDARFEKVIARTEMPVLVDVWAEWCGPCRMMAPQFEAAAGTLKGQVLFAKLDSDANPQTSVKYRIRSIPTLLLFRGGQEVKRMSGALSAGQIVQFVQ